MAEEAAKEAASAPAAGPAQKPPFLLIILLVVNMLVVVGVGAMLYMGRKKDAAQPKVEDVIQGEKHAQDEEHAAEKSFVGKVIPLETFIVNLAGSKGRRVAKVDLQLELEGDGTAEEIEKRKAQIRDIIIILLSGKTYDEVSTREGKEQLRNEIKDTVNAFLTKGKILNVFFTDFIYN